MSDKIYTIIYFSPTGNARFLAEQLSRSLSEKIVELLALEFTDPLALKSNDHLILMFPIHGFNAPRTVKRFVRQIPSNLYKSVSLIAVGCNTIWINDAASLDLKKIFIKKGYMILLDEVLAMPLTFIMSFPEKIKNDLFKESKNQIKKISDKIINKRSTNKEVPFKSKVISFIGKVESPAARLFGLELHAKKTCISCGVCWSNCPEHNIKKGKNDRPKFGLKCSMCMRCIYNCPTNSITPYISKFIPIKNGYKVTE